MRDAVDAEGGVGIQILHVLLVTVTQIKMIFPINIQSRPTILEKTRQFLNFLLARIPIQLVAPLHTY